MVDESVTLRSDVAVRGRLEGLVVELLGVVRGNGEVGECEAVVRRMAETLGMRVGEREDPVKRGKAHVRICPYCRSQVLSYGPNKPQNLRCKCGAEMRYGNWVKAR